MWSVSDGQEEKDAIVNLHQLGKTSASYKLKSFQVDSSCLLQ